MQSFMLFFHFIGLALGVGTNVAVLVVQRVAAGSPPEAAAVLRALPGRLAPLSWTGVGILWLTGLYMFGVTYGGVAPSALFWAKLACVVALTAVIVAIFVTMRQARAGNRAVMARMRYLGPLAMLLALGAVLFAVLTFG